MTDFGKNFRTAYYESLGFKEETNDLNLLEDLLKADVIDVSRLRHFCLKRTVPVFYRGFVWKLLLGVEPVHRDDETCQFVLTQHREKHGELKRAFLVINERIDASILSSPDPISGYRCSATDFAEMYCIEKSTPSVFSQAQLSVIGSLVMDVFSDEVEAYCVFSRFSSQWEKAIHYLDIMLTDFSTTMIQTDRALHHHLVSLSAFSSIPVHEWIKRCFAGFLPYPELENVWDKVVSGSWMVVVYVAVSAVITHSRQLLKMKSCQKILQLMKNLPDDSAASIVQRGLDIWETNGSPMQIYTSVS